MKNVSKKQYLIAASGATLLLLLNIFFLNSILIGITAIILYGYVFSRFIADIFLSEENQGRLFYGFLLLLTGEILTNTALYYLHGITPVTVAIALLLPFLLFLSSKSLPLYKGEMAAGQRGLRGRAPFLGIANILLNIALLTTLFLNQTTSLMPSPWQAVNHWFFITFAISTAFLILFVSKNKNYQTSIFAMAVHLFVMFGVAAILYPLGYGFDAFIHRATEEWILLNGSILPKTPYYIGQYSLVAWLAHITSLPIFYLDVYLVPILASISLPIVVSNVLKKIWNIPYKVGILLTLFIPFIPFLSLHLTTPHNLVILFTILIVFTTLGYLKNKTPLIIPFSLSLASLATHPLVAAPTFVFLIATMIIKKTSARGRTSLWLEKLSPISYLLSFLLITLTVPILFILNNFLANAPLPTFTNPLSSLPYFLELFARPYWYLENALIIYELLYTWQLLIIPIAISLCFAGFFISKKKLKAEYLFPIATISFFLSAWLLRSWIVFPDVVSYEQGDYPLRLLKTSLIFILPFGTFMIYKILANLQTYKLTNLSKTRKTAMTITLVTIISASLMLSFYFSYPQRNIKSRFPGFNITAADFQAVEWIHEREKKTFRSIGRIDGPSLFLSTQVAEIDYIVLSNQLVSASALTKYSFAKYFQTESGEIFYYSIPTGGKLYQQYGKMLYEGQKREYMEDAMQIAGVDKAYFVVNSYWANADKIIEGAKESADGWEVINNQVWIFIYEK